MTSVKKDFVIYVGAMVMPDGNAAAQRSTALCRSLLSCGMKPIVVGLKYAKPKEQVSWPTRDDLQGIDCFSLPYPVIVSEWLRRLWDISPIVDIIKSCGIERVHSIVALDCEFTLQYRLRSFCRKHKISYVVDTVEWYGPSPRPFPHNMAKNLDTFLRMRCLYPSVENLICISSFLYDYYKNHVPNILYLPGTVDATADKWRQLGTYSPNHVLTIGYAGNPGKGCSKERLDWLIRAVCDMNAAGNTCRLKIAGVERNAFERQYPDIESLPYYRDVVDYLGKLSHKECLSLIRSVDFSAIVREDTRATRAGFPTKLSESFACGTPVITTPSSNIADFIVDGRNGFATIGFEYGALVQGLHRAYTLCKGDLVHMHEWTQRNNPLKHGVFSRQLCVFMKKAQNEKR